MTYYSSNHHKLCATVPMCKSLLWLLHMLQQEPKNLIKMCLSSVLYCFFLKSLLPATWCKVHIAPLTVICNISSKVQSHRNDQQNSFHSNCILFPIILMNLGKLEKFLFCFLNLKFRHSILIVTFCRRHF